MIVYLSLIGNVKSFVKEVDMESISIDSSNPFIEIHTKFILIVPTYDDEITEIVSDFIDYKGNEFYLEGIVGSGNRNFGKSFCFNAKELARKYKKPLLMTFELSGTAQDIAKFKEEVGQIGITEINK